MTVFAHIPHAAGAAAVGVPLHPNDLLIFGNAKVGTPLMQSAPTTGIDLPLKVLVWQEAEGSTWLSYNEIRPGLRGGTDSSADDPKRPWQCALDIRMIRCHLSRIDCSRSRVAAA